MLSPLKLKHANLSLLRKNKSLVVERRSRSLARFKQPRRVELVDALPRNAMGKVQKKALRERYA